MIHDVSRDWNHKGEFIKFLYNVYDILFSFLNYSNTPRDFNIKEKFEDKI